MTDGAIVIDLKRDARQALRRIFNVGYGGPGAATAPQGALESDAPAPHTLLILNIPGSCVPQQATSFYDIFASTSSYNTNTNVYARLLGMLSLVATRPPNGFGAQVNPKKDARGTVDGNGQHLFFDHNGRKYERTIHCVEDLVSEAGAVAGYRIWFFVVDPALNVGHALQSIAQTNGIIYGDRDAHDPHTESHYMQHTDVVSSADIYTLFAQYVAGGRDSIGRNQGPVRANCDDLERHLVSLASPMGVGSRDLTDADQKGSPQQVFSSATSFTFHMTSVCEEQRNVSAYFTAPQAAVGGDDDDDDDDGNGLVVPNDAPLGYENEADGEEEEDDELAALMAQFDEPVDAGTSAAPNANLQSNAPCEAKDFVGFPRPELVQCIPVTLFGRCLLNVPLRSTYCVAADTIDTDTMDLDYIEKQLAEEAVARGTMDEGEDDADDLREMRAKGYYQTHVSAIYAPRHTLYFDFDAVDTETALRKTYRCFLDARDKQIGIGLESDLRGKLRRAKRIIYREDVRADTFSMGGRRVLFEVPLPETCNEDAVTVSELRHFSENNDYLKLRLENHERYNAILAAHSQGSSEFVDAIKQFRYEAADKFWEITMKSTNLPGAIIKARNAFKALSPQDHWPEHHLIEQSLSCYANLKLILLERYNEIFRGATTQNVFEICYRVALNTFMYHFGLRPSALLMGGGGAGKSWAMLAVQALMAPGTFECYTHITSKAYSTSTSDCDETCCMHEAPLHYLGIDARGFECPGDPVLKDRLTRQRSTTRSIIIDDSGNRLTKTDIAMVMQNLLIATNDVVPEGTALMDRFLKIPVHHTSRVGFNKGDQSNVSQTEVNNRLNAHHRLQSQVFAFYVMIAEKMAMCWIIPPPSTDCANSFMREILQIYKDNTGEDVANARKRTMAMHIMRTSAIMNMVHATFCTPLSWKFRYERGADGVNRLRPFHPRMMIDHAMPRAYVTDEIVVDVMTMLSFLWEPKHLHDILETIVVLMNNAPHHSASASSSSSVAASETCLNSSTTQFRFVRNPAYNRRGGGGGGHRRFATQSMGGGGGGGGSDASEEPEFIIDPRYVVVSGQTDKQIFSKICEASKSATNTIPSVPHVKRVIRTLQSTFRASHAATIVPKEAPRDKQWGGDASLYDSEESNGASTLAGPHVTEARVLDNLTAYVGESDGTALMRVYDEQNFAWRCDGRTVVDERTPVVVLEQDPKNSKARVLCVLVEAIMSDAFRDGITSAIRTFLSKDNLATPIRRFITSNEYTHVHPDGHTEVMPQFKEVLDIERREGEPMLLRHMQVGTTVSNAYMSSTLNPDQANENPHQVLLRNHLGTILREPPNAHFGRLHWSACHLPLSNGWYAYTPEVDSETICGIMNDLSAEKKVGIVFIEDYPRSPAAVEVNRRRGTDMLLDPNHRQALIDSDLTVDSTAYHTRTGLADAVKDLDFCYFDHNAHRVAYHGTPTAAQMAEIDRLKENVGHYAKSFTDIRSARAESHAPPRLVMATPSAEDAPAQCRIQSATRTRLLRTSFIDRMDSLYAILGAAPESRKRARATASSPSGHTPDPSRPRKHAKTSHTSGPSYPRAQPRVATNGGII